jgi:hypothetical protein
MDGGDARDKRGFGEPAQHAPAYFPFRVPEAHGKQRRVRALLPEQHDGEAGQALVMGRLVPGATSPANSG